MTDRHSRQPAWCKTPMRSLSTVRPSAHLHVQLLRLIGRGTVVPTRGSFDRSDGTEDEEMASARLLQAPSYVTASGAKQGSFVNLQGLTLATYEWEHKTQGEPKGIILAMHGVSCHLHYEYLNIGTFAAEDGSKGYEGAELHEPQYAGSWVERLNEEGYLFTGMDLQSYGLSEGARGLQYYFERFEDHVTDLVQFRKMVSEEYPNTPIYLMGISMGGCIAARLAEFDCAFPYAGLILLAPMLSIEQLKKRPINKVLLPLADCMSALAPTLRLADKAAHPNVLLRKHFEADPLNETTYKIRVRVGAECLKVVERARQELTQIKCPLLAVHSRHDTMTDPAGSELAVDLATSSSKTLKLLDDPYLWHELGHEPGNAKVLQLVLEWLAMPRVEVTNS
ncbi:Monoglyceride lipase [Hondaea fermentalgiana]|uniref:Monoglyceride lipase n=1 Tax=Hondaea fermentalgiana TaxID=2315210 RepID=A0A2R5G1Q2_9STRA|nr:Monoglyceride lipase [Hondaea fermentalgiana]|eukprot:GBG24455.1 Monoglyceride lipase [Hondaea fermentalgiana]